MTSPDPYPHHFVVATRTGRYLHAVRGNGRGFVEGQRLDSWEHSRPVCWRVPGWHSFYTPKPGDRRPLCSRCARYLHRVVDHELAAADG